MSAGPGFPLLSGHTGKITVAKMQQPPHRAGMALALGTGETYIPGLSRRIFIFGGPYGLLRDENPMREVTHFLMEMAGELYEVLPYFLVGIFLEAYIRTKKWHVKIRKTLSGKGFLTIVIATMLGIVSPLCACGILPLTVSLMIGGLPLAPAMSLLIASPLLSPAGYTLALKNIGPLWANGEVIAALFMGIYAGLLVQFLERRGFNAMDLYKKELPKGDFHDADYPEDILRCGCNEMFSKKVERAGHGPSLVFLAKAAEGGWKVGKFLVLGIAVTVLARDYLPNMVEALVTSKHPLTVVGITLGAVPLHLTQITATAILFGLQDMGVSPAAGMALLIGGPVTALPVMAMFLTLFKPKVFFLYLGICLSGTLITAYTFQALVG